MEEVAQLFLGDLYGQIIQFADDDDQQQRALTRLLDIQARSAVTTQVLRHQLSHSKQPTPQSQPTSPTQQTSSQSQQTPIVIDTGKNKSPPSNPLDHQAITALLSRILEAQAKPSVAHVHPVQINKPQNFSGKNQHKFRSWWDTVIAYLESFPNSFDTDRIKINWVGSLLTDTAQDWHQYRVKRNKVTSQEDSWATYCMAIEGRFTDAAEGSTNLDRMAQLRYEGDTAKYLTDLLQLNDIVGWSGLPFRTHISRTLPDKIIKLVFSTQGSVPDNDEDFLKAIAAAGRIYEKMLANPGTGYAAKAKTYKQKKFTQNKEQHNQHPFISNSSNPNDGQKREKIWPSLKDALQGIDQSLINQRKANTAACLRCGREYHKALMCYARKDLDGRPLPPPPTKKTPDTVAALKRALEEDSTEEVEPELEQQPPQKVAKISGLTEELPIFVDSSDSDSDF
ncbi:hypothetical protein E4U10_000346 [Claviceps purpurea]|nr:hypothetical protein E4U10_000346 [Claviceps purpurea]